MWSLYRTTRQWQRLGYRAYHMYYGCGSGLRDLPQWKTALKPQLIKWPVSGVERVGAGWQHTLVGLKDGRVYAFGLNQSGQLGLGQLSERDAGFVQGLPSKPVTHLAAGREHSIVVLDEKEVYVFGNSMYGQLGIGKSKWSNVEKPVCIAQPTHLPLPDPTDRIRQVVCGLDHTVFLTTTGRLYTCGWGADGQLGNGSSKDQDQLTRIDHLIPDQVVALASSTDFTFALTDTQSLYVWGNAEYGQAMLGQRQDRILSPVRVDTLPSSAGPVVSMGAGGTFALVLTASGQVFSCGYGVIGLGKNLLETLTPLPIPALKNIQRVWCSTDYAVVLDQKGRLYTWGLAGRYGLLGQGDIMDRFQPSRLSLPNTVRVVNVVCGGQHMLIEVTERK
jgi:alpha-tubulin suppressor-like RCC1 family protein